MRNIHLNQTISTDNIMECCDLFFRLRPEKDSDDQTQLTDTKTENGEKKSMSERCRECRQFLDDTDLKFFQGDPEDAVS